VHIPDAREFLSPFENHRQPWAVLHELAHAYHDRVLGFDDARVMAAWKKFRDGGRYTSVVTSPGPMRRHYALTDEKEFFAEMTEALFRHERFLPLRRRRAETERAGNLRPAARHLGPAAGTGESSTDRHAMKRWISHCVAMCRDGPRSRVASRRIAITRDMSPRLAVAVAAPNEA
jgi:hypothetical protein